MLWWLLVATQSNKLGDYSIIRELLFAAKTRQQISESYFPPQIWRVIPRWDVQSFIQYSVPMLIFLALGRTTLLFLLHEMLTRIQPIITILGLFYSESFHISNCTLLLLQRVLIALISEKSLLCLWSLPAVADLCKRQLIEHFCSLWAHSCIGCLSTCYLGCNHLTVKVWNGSWLLISIISLHLWSCPWVSKGCGPFMDRGSGDASFRLNTWQRWQPSKEHHLLILGWHQSKPTVSP